MKKTHFSIIVGFIFSIIAIIVVTGVYPNFDEFNIKNQSWNGLSKFDRDTHPVQLSNSAVLVAYSQGSTLFIIGPDKEFTRSEVSVYSNYLKRGGEIILADDFGTGNDILEAMGLDIRFDGGLLCDPIFMERNLHLPRVTAENYGLNYLVLNYATFLTGLNSKTNEVLVWSSPISYSIDSNGVIVKNSSMPVIAEASIGKGKLVLISDSSVFINGMIDKGSNEDLLKIYSSDIVLVDTSHNTPSSVGLVKASLADTYNLLGLYEVRYSVLILFVIGLLRLRLSITPIQIDPVEELLQKHPEYDREQLKWLNEERKKARRPQ